MPSTRSRLPSFSTTAMEVKGRLLVRGKNSAIRYEMQAKVSDLIPTFRGSSCQYFSRVEFNIQGYQDALRRAGFEVLEVVDLSPHLGTSYQCLADITAGKGDDHDGEYRELSYAYGQMGRTVNADELGRGLYLARK